MVRVNHTHPDVVGIISRHIKACVLSEPDCANRQIVILCIGSDRSTGDCLGPYVGTILGNLEGAVVLGTLDDPVHATNLSSVTAKMKSQYDNPIVIAVDACLGRLGSVGYISVDHEPCRPGEALNKGLPEVGNISIAGIVNVGGFMEHLVLSSTRMGLVYRMSEAIAVSIKQFVDDLKLRIEQPSDFLKEVACTETESLVANSKAKVYELNMMTSNYQGKHKKVKCKRDNPIFIKN